MFVYLGAVLASQPVRWDAFYEMGKLAQGNKAPEIRQMVYQGSITLHKAHDDLEKPARELGVIDRKTKRTPSDETRPTRQYEKPGGVDALQKDFDKFSGETTSPEPDIDMKTLPNGSKIDNRLRIKVRYP